MIVERVVRGLDERLDGGSFLRRNLTKVFPDHWSFMLGEIALYAFALLVLTGIFLTFFFQASPEPVVYDGPYAPMRGRTVSAAYDSVLRLSFEVRAGLVMRQTHHWAALLFMAAVVAHLLRVFFTGAFRKPRELTWVLGVLLLFAGIGAGFTGYSLPDDLLSGTGLRIIYSGVLSIPVVGAWAAFLFFGGEFPAHALLSRLYVLHVLLIPLVIAGLIGAHLALVWRQTHTQFPGPGRTEDTVTGIPVWPRFALKALGLMFVTWGVAAGLGGLVQINPVWLYGPFVPYSAPSPAQPDFYAGWLEGLLRLWPNWEFHLFGRTIGTLFLPAVVVPGVITFVLALWPWIEERVSGDHAAHHFAQRPREAPVRSGIGAAGVAFFTVLMLAGSNDVLAAFLSVEVDTLNGVLTAAVVVLPIACGLVTYRICRDLRDGGGHPIARPGRARVRRTAAGAFEVEHEPGGPAR
ncbi:MAG: ubiquinol-cytochrome c reductase cytochrome b subunit [Actinomycetota bacterium]|jgi:ubiquinol-cytochrome c reductase cytochrome b subunit|nr:MAG: ubiquinol-cytochrome c reductase cytochrome b subunit [Actinomycetota bacterium]